MTAIGDTAQQAQESLSRQVAPVVDPIVSAASSKWENLSDSVSNRVESGRNYLGGIVGAGIAAATPAIKTLEQSAEGLKNWAGDVTQPARDFADKAGQTIGGIAQAADKATSGIRQNIQEGAASVGEEVGNKLNEFDNFFQSAQSFLNNLGKVPQKATMALLAPVILATSQGLDRLPPEKREALANATGKAAQIGRVVGNIAGGASKLAGGALAGAKIGFKLDEGLIGGDISLDLVRTSKQKQEEEEAENLRRSFKNPNDTQT
jgi:hypothetical protein